MSYKKDLPFDWIVKVPDAVLLKEDEAEQIDPTYDGTIYPDRIYKDLHLYQNTIKQALDINSSRTRTGSKVIIQVLPNV